MLTKLSTKGQVVVPDSVRRRLGLHPGDILEVGVENGSIVLTPQAPRKFAVTFGVDPITNMPVLRAEDGAPPLTSEQVAELLADFP
jgi:AbrB family looped-hinge helix DNA binding protein